MAPDQSTGTAALSRALLRQIGEALYGPHHWKAAVASEAGVSDRTVRYWLAGDKAMPADLLPKLMRLLRARRVDIERLLERAA